MVKVDDVYQKVLALANKEQRGYITPQDFNLFASQAQLEIFEQYFYDLNQARKTQGNDTVIADADDMLEDKLQQFEVVLDSIDTALLNTVGYGKELPTHLHAQGALYRLLYASLLDGDFNEVECELLGARDFANLKVSPLIKPSKSRPVANVRSGVIVCNDGIVDQPPHKLTYIKTPHKPNWTYSVVNKRAMYDPNSSTVDFGLHQSEEIQLVNKILRLAGLATEQVDVMRAGGAMDSMINQQKYI